MEKDYEQVVSNKKKVPDKNFEEIQVEESDVIFHNNKIGLSENEIRNDASKDVEEKIEQLKVFTSKAILSQKEKNKLSGIMETGNIQQYVINTLNANNYRFHSSENEKLRLESIDMMESAIKYGNQHTKEFFLSFLENSILDTSYRSIEDKTLKKSLVGDKIEYLILLKKNDTIRYDKMVDYIHAIEDRVLIHCLKEAGGLI